MSTMKDVAKIANVSVATVSHVINKTRYVSPGIIKKVESAIENVGYRIRKGDHNIKTQIKTIAIIVPDITDPFYSNVIKGVTETIDKKRFRLGVFNTETASSFEEIFLNLSINNDIVGLLYVPTTDNSTVTNKLKNLRIPYVLLDKRIDGVEADIVLSDYYNGAYKAIGHLVRSGHERIGLILSVNNKTSYNEILRGYTKALADSDILFDQRLVVGDSYSYIGARDAFNKLVSLDNRPTSILCSNITIAIGVFKAIRDRGWECPTDISIVTFNNTEWTDIFTPPITSIEQYPKKIGFKAVELLLSKVNSKNQNLTESIIQTDLKIRKSTQVIGRWPFGEKAANHDGIEITESEIEEIKTKNYTAAISFHYSDKNWSRIHEEGIRDTFNHLGIRILAVCDAHFDPEMQNKQLESLMKMEPDVLLSIPTDEVETAESYRKVIERKIKLVLVSNVPKGLKHGDYVTCVGVNERENGQIAGRILGEYLITHGKKNVGLLKHGAPFFATKQRDASAEQVITEEFPELEIVAETTFVIENRVYEKTYDMMKSHPEIEGIYVSWEGPALEVINVLRNLNREDVAVVTSDLDYEVALSMASGGIVKGLSTQHLYEQGRAMALAAANALLGKKVPPFLGITPYPVTSKNLLKAWKFIIKEMPPDKIIKALKRYRGLKLNTSEE